MKLSLVQIVAQNVKRAFEHSRFKSQRELAADAEVAPNSVKNLMHPETRAATTRGDVSPRLDVLEKIARSMGHEAWHLMIENFDPSKPFDRPLTVREAQLHKQIGSAYQQLDDNLRLQTQEPPPPDFRQEPLELPPPPPPQLPGMPSRGSKLQGGPKRSQQRRRK